MTSWSRWATFALSRIECGDLASEVAARAGGPLLELDPLVLDEVSLDDRFSCIRRPVTHNDPLDRPDCLRDDRLDGQLDETLPHCVPA